MLAEPTGPATARAVAGTDADELADALLEYAPRLERCRRLVEAAATAGPVPRDQLGFLGRGKLVRPLVTFLAGLAAGADEEPLAAAAAAVELLHAGSLVHDDIIDRAETRRGLPALHARVGRDVALVAGDFLLLRAVSVLAGADGAGPERRGRAVACLSRYAELCCLGQAAELAATGGEVTEAWYLHTVSRKTGAPFAAAASLGAIMAGADAAAQEAAHAYGQGLGIAYQIRDDVMDLLGCEEELGKPVGNSLARGRPSLLLLYLEEAERGPGGAGAPGDRRSLAELVRRRGVLQRVARTQQRFIDTAVRAAGTLRPCRERQHLVGLARWAAVSPSLAA